MTTAHPTGQHSTYGDDDDHPYGRQLLRRRTWGHNSDDAYNDYVRLPLLLLLLLLLVGLVLLRSTCVLRATTSATHYHYSSSSLLLHAPLVILRLRLPDQHSTTTHDRRGYQATTDDERRMTAGVRPPRPRPTIYYVPLRPRRRRTLQHGLASRAGLVVSSPGQVVSTEPGPM